MNLPTIPDQHQASDLRSSRSPVTPGDLMGRWRQVLLHPRVSAFDLQRAMASWAAVWLSLALLAVVEALGVAFAAYGPDAASGYSSLPVGPQLHLPQTPLLPLAALLGAPAQFFIFTGLLYLVARMFGGRGDFKTQAYLIALFWAPLMIASDVVELIPLPIVAKTLALLLRAYALCLCALALASAHRLRLARAWAALLAPVVVGLLIGFVALVVAGTQLAALIK
jgi:hypothetical protein